MLDLACGDGRHAVELARRGFSVVGVDLAEDLIRIAAEDGWENPNVELILADLRDLDFEDEFDIVLSLHSGALGYFENDRENHRTFETVARALRSGGRSLMQIPNALYAETRLPEKSWTLGTEWAELVEQRWNPRNRCIEGAVIAIELGGDLHAPDPVPIRQRLYTLAELRDLLRSVGMSLAGTYDADGAPHEPTDSELEIFAVARKE